MPEQKVDWWSNPKTKEGDYLNATGASLMECVMHVIKEETEAEAEEEHTTKDEGE